MKDKLRQLNLQDTFYWGFVFIILLSLISGIITNSVLPYAFPFVILLGYLCIVDYQKIFLLYFAVLPFSIEVYFDNGLGTDLFTEPLALILTAIGLLIFLQKNPHRINGSFLKNPISIIVLLHFVWLFFLVIRNNPPDSSQYF